MLHSRKRMWRQLRAVRQVVTATSVRREVKTANLTAVLPLPATDADSAAFAALAASQRLSLPPDDATRFNASDYATRAVDTGVLTVEIDGGRRARRQFRLWRDSLGLRQTDAIQKIGCLLAFALPVLPEAILDDLRLRPWVRRLVCSHDRVMTAGGAGPEKQAPSRVKPVASTYCAVTERNKRLIRTQEPQELAPTAAQTHDGLPVLEYHI